MVLDHLCRRLNCVNPEHLEAVTDAENVLRGMFPQPLTHCKWGHELNEINTRIRFNYKGQRRGWACRTCERLGIYKGSHRPTECRQCPCEWHIVHDAWSFWQHRSYCFQCRHRFFSLSREKLELIRRDGVDWQKVGRGYYRSSLLPISVLLMGNKWRLKIDGEVVSAPFRTKREASESARDYVKFYIDAQSAASLKVDLGNS